MLYVECQWLYPKNVERKLKEPCSSRKIPRIWTTCACLMPQVSAGWQPNISGHFIPVRLPKLIVLAFVWYTVVMDDMMTRTERWGGIRGGQGRCRRDQWTSTGEDESEEVCEVLAGGSSGLEAETEAQSDLYLSARELSTGTLKERRLTLEADTYFKFHLSHVIYQLDDLGHVT